MEDKKWFILSDSQVTGPYTKSDIDTKINAFNSPLIWGRGQTEWMPPDKWERLLQDFESTQARARQAHTERMWKVKIDNQEQRPMTHDQMIDFLKTKTDFADVQIWTEGYSEWKDIYQIHKIMDELGVSRRQHPRVPIMGTLACEGVTGNFSARVLSISEGGLGITEAHQVKIGEKFKTILKSPNLYAPIHSTVEVVYVGADGYAGLKFAALHSESKSTIIEYVKKFTELKN